MESRLAHIGSELKEHLPYTIFSALIGMILLGVLTVFLGESRLPSAANVLFHVFHPTHILFSAAATAAMFWRHDRRLPRAIGVGFVGSVGICGLSDAVFPFLGGTFLGMKMEMHICLIRHPFLILPFAVLGIFAGFLSASAYERKSTIFSHASHVFISSMASILYLVAFGLKAWVQTIGLIFVIVVLAVMIPCCTSDIIFPLLFTGGEGTERHRH